MGQFCSPQESFMMAALRLVTNCSWRSWRVGGPGRALMSGSIVCSSLSLLIHFLHSQINPLYGILCTCLMVEKWNKLLSMIFLMPLWCSLSVHGMFAFGLAFFAYSCPWLGLIAFSVCNVFCSHDTLGIVNRGRWSPLYQSDMFGLHNREGGGLQSKMRERVGMDND